MERDLVMGMRREAAAAVFLGASMEESSPAPLRCSSRGCQSGWTLYLDHSDGQQRCVYHLEPGHQRWMLPRAQVPPEDEYDDDSMVSDASSGPPPPRLLDYEDEEALLRRGHREQRCCSSSFGVVPRGGASASGSGSGSSVGTLSRSFHSQGLHEARPRRRPVLVRGEEATLQYHDVDDNDDLDDTASSSAVLRCPMAAIVYDIAPPAESMSSTSYNAML